MEGSSHADIRPIQPDVHFAPTPERVVAEMLKIADVKESDVVYDLGCGDGRIVIEAARTRGAHGVGVELDPILLAQCRALAASAGVADRLAFWEQDFFHTDLHEASVLMLYLLDSLNIRLQPKIFAECRPGTRVVTYSFEMGEWEPDDHIPIAANGVSLWIVPADFSGTWRVLENPGPLAIKSVQLQQRFQKLSGSGDMGGVRCPILDGRIIGSRCRFVVEDTPGAAEFIVEGELNGGLLELKLGGDAAGVVWRGARQLPVG